ncbi:hypothetical protein RvY_10824 [Ramazzottius varieornatus]|uniref:Uncharacterized protein n=1 Tax=Ramazzottius varieornatus TaxID=947166 RepID=A0A1D1VJG1_RAMVA|nr:hypothetical protein RvY_10824 [Ramazzottius varieornatus]
MVTALTKSLNAEQRQRKSQIKVTSLSPVHVKTGIRDLVAKENPEERDRLEKVASCPLLTPQEGADGVVYILGTPPHVNIRELKIVPTEHRF